jgi:hypothetical protein
MNDLPSLLHTAAQSAPPPGDLLAGVIRHERRRGRRQRSAAVCASVVSVAAIAGGAAWWAQPTNAPVHAIGQPTTSQQSSTALHPTGLQVVEVAHVRGFIRAYNAGDLTGALAQFSRVQAVGFSDCDYSTQQLVDGQGRAAVTAWLRRSLADHDRLTIGDIAVSPPDQLGVLGVAFSRRTGDSIARAGHPSGITPSTGAKIQFDNAGLITEFANGPYGGPPDGCRLP